METLYGVLKTAVVVSSLDGILWFNRFYKPVQQLCQMTVFLPFRFQYFLKGKFRFFWKKKDWIIQLDNEITKHANKFGFWVCIFRNSDDKASAHFASSSAFNNGMAARLSIFRIKISTIWQID